MSENPQRPTDDRDDVATLIRLAGQRAAVPDERSRRVRAAARATWKHETRGRLLRRRMVLVAAVAAAAVIAAVALWPFVPGPAAPLGGPGSIAVETLAGSARLLGGPGPAQALEVGRRIPAGSAIETGDEGRVALRLASHHSVRIDRSSRVRFLDDEIVALEHGAIYVDSGPAGGASSTVAVLTPFGLIREIGTQFEVRLDDGGITLRLREGAVVLEREVGDLEVQAGSEIRLDADGTVTHREIAPDEALWDWAVDAAPMPALDGRTAREFLDWAARERGLQLVFVDDAVERSAAVTVLGGAAGDLTVDEALDAVLPTCRMRHRIGDGRLVVEPLAVTP